MTQPVYNEQSYTFTDYLTWDDDIRRELIDGEIYMMSPAPSRSHQTIIGNLFLQFGNFLKGKPCEVFLSPFDVRLNYNSLDNTVVQPDLLVVCDSSIVDDKRCNGTPDLVIEVLSPSSTHRDTITKLLLYQRASVPEYWVVDPLTNSVHVYLLDNQKYYVTPYQSTDTIPVKVLNGCLINLNDVFDVFEE